ncbi:HET-domain-containing protein [Lojkania enalia]|uniref:HET-domain-containing protein n=1 Tax=Lojkania enalia TaxID=147567 RepID=A0A9P4MZU4_9PLEO|nr:HET-domain-containing protein [Didymosphaeria enalia]
MNQYKYAPLPVDPFTIRLVRLFPSSERSAPIHCELVTYPISQSSGAHIYEALSYVWGPQEDAHQISLGPHKCRVEVRRNLHAALTYLRDPIFERVLWVDILCINQKDDTEKAHQVAAMGRIYGYAQRVIAWLGEEADDSAFAFQDLSWAALGSHEGQESLRIHESENNHQEVSSIRELQDLTFHGEREHEKLVERKHRPLDAVLQRGYFRRIWILQEMAAARHLLLKCGHSEIQANTFRMGLKNLKINRLKSPDLERYISVVLSLWEKSSTRESLKGQAHLGIQTLSGLIDMFHLHLATDRREKVFALLGMVSDTHRLALLQPDYTIEWNVLFKHLCRYMFGEHATVIVSQREALAYIGIRGFILGRVHTISNEGIWAESQTIRINSMTPHRHLDEQNNWSKSCRLPKSAKQIMIDDMVCLLESERKLCIVRAGKYYLRIIQVTDIHNTHDLFGMEAGDAPWWSFLETMDSDPLNLSLIWDWDEFSDQSTTQEEPDALLLMRDSIFNAPYPESSPSKARIEALSNTASIYLSLEEYGQASELLEEKLHICEQVFGPEHPKSQDSEKQLVGTQKKKEKYHQLRQMIVKWAVTEYSYMIDDMTKNDVSAFQWCLRLRSCIGMTSQREHSPDLDWYDFASKSLHREITEDMVVTAISRQPSIILDQASHFFLEFALNQVPVSHEIVLAAAGNDGALQLLFKPLSCPVDILRTITEKRWSQSRFRPTIERIIHRSNSIVNITPDDIEAIAIQALAGVGTSWELEGMMLLLLKAAGSSMNISQQTFNSVVAKGDITASKILRILLQHVGDDFEPSEDVLITMTKQRQHAQKLFAIMLQHLGRRVHFTEPVLIAGAVAADISLNPFSNYDASIFPLLLYRKDIEITEGIVREAKGRLRNDKQIGEKLYELNNKKFVTQKDFDIAAKRFDQIGYINLLTLFREHRDAFRITRDNVEAAMEGSGNGAVGECREDILALLLEHAEDEYFRSIVQDTVAVKFMKDSRFFRALGILAKRCDRLDLLFSGSVRGMK